MQSLRFAPKRHRSVNLPAAHELARLEIFTLDYDKMLHALMMADVGLGIGFALLIRTEDNRITSSW